MAHPRMRALPLGLFAGLAVLLAAVGLYGVLAYAVARRRRELGIRMALGAGRLDVLALVVRRGLVLAFAGLGIGLSIAVAAGLAGARSWLAELVHGVAPLDLPTLAGVSVLLLTVSRAAAFVPARRASAVDPLVALKND